MRLELLSIDAFTTSSGVSHKIATLVTGETSWARIVQSEICPPLLQLFDHFDFLRSLTFEPKGDLPTRTPSTATGEKVGRCVDQPLQVWVKKKCLAKYRHSRQQPYGCFE